MNASKQAASEILLSLNVLVVSIAFVIFALSEWMYVSECVCASMNSCKQHSQAFYSHVERRLKQRMC